MLDYQKPAKLAKRCPCCGSAKILTDDPEWIAERALRSIAIECEECGLTMHAVGDTYNIAYREALTAWNRRAS